MTSGSIDNWQIETLQAQVPHSIVTIGTLEATRVDLAVLQPLRVPMPTSFVREDWPVGMRLNEGLQQGLNIILDRTESMLGPVG